MIQLLIELSALLALWLGMNTWQRDAASPGRWTFIAMCLTVVVWCALVLAGLDGTVTPDLAERGGRVAAHALAPLWLVLSLSTRDTQWTTKGRARFAPLLFLPCALVACMPSVGAGATEAWQQQLVGWGLVAYSWSLAAVGSLHFILAAGRVSSRGDRARRVTVALVTMTPLMASIGFRGLGLHGIEPTPILVATALVALRSELFSGDLIRALPLSQHDFVGRLPVPVILTDLLGRVMEINPAAQHSLGTDRGEVLERNIEAILSEATGAPPFESWALVNEGREVGRIYVPCEAVDVARMEPA
jgi:PAS domain-containing protein